MKVRTKEDLLDLLDADLAWRKKELSYLLSNVNVKSPNYKTSVRSGIVLLYSHWEGFIKLASEYYLSYVKYLKLNYSELRECFIAISLKEKLTVFENTNKSTIHTQVVSFLLNDLNQKASIPNEYIIKTGSNLNSEVLKEILTTVGIDYADYELKANLIDGILLRHRNSIAHGQYLPLEEIEYKHLHNEILSMMINYKIQISNAVVLELYKK